MKTNRVLFYCRAGFESDMATEVLERASELDIYGYPTFTKSSGFITFQCHQAEQAELLVRKLSFQSLIFARQMFVCAEQIVDLNTTDRIGPILLAAEDFPMCGDLRVEYADTTDGRELSKLCRKLTVPLRQSLRKKGKLSAKENKQKPCLHAFFTNGDSVYVGYSYSNNSSPYPLGILRLKFPNAAPSRSTLKLDEAFQLFIPANAQDSRLALGMQAVDLGACPGGWTYQLVQRGMFVQAVDNGAMDEALMETGQVKYFAEDGFKFEPRKKNVYWLVCDMIEQPQKVAKLMANWLIKGWCKEAMFNLKLPMKQRYESVKQAESIVTELMDKHQCNFSWQAKHLYHDREEVTVHLRLV
ncbi:23S rRNA (cytidine(2498)-2'-O)-methyltransferase RlmM [Aliiglaciecola sp. LCG003]|uniref:23S rRNA (cytidine(2498)-2'-O)-methyltransferase RlmM n=1 Tax=Aliiglaciecola sp. LCG003 TaxID=3053655 RepID=UPI00257297C6|nr:23S rRNA (cytidine(2498)-2'-O)-methyltransferase RlmM [Aliiglaciecola sp. LCG003]WJG08240.1 23S rRNA (cytidine(2498)-2'-O)-methyltransferase RlmM [Aliiglaciecola sp. LCG003]